MALSTGLNPLIRMDQPDDDQERLPVDIIVTEEGGDIPEFDDKGQIVKIKHGDGTVTISLDGKPLNDNLLNKKDTGWFSNLAEDIDEGELHRIRDDLERGIQDDDQSRQEWLDERAKGIILLGLKIEVPGQQGAADGAPVEGMSKVRHPLLARGGSALPGSGEST